MGKDKETLLINGLKELTTLKENVRELEKFVHTHVKIPQKSYNIERAKISLSSSQNLQHFIPLNLDLIIAQMQDNNVTDLQISIKL